jgi:hypothetical protein
LAARRTSTHSTGNRLPRPPQHLQVPALSGPGTRPRIPPTFVIPRPPQHV